MGTMVFYFIFFTIILLLLYFYVSGCLCTIEKII